MAERDVRSSRVGERGSILPLVALALAAAVFSVLVLVALAERAVQRAEAQTAADAAALAALYEGEEGAADLAERNGARLVDYIEDGPSVLAIVTLGGVEARARAEIAWDDIPIDVRE